MNEVMKVFNNKKFGNVRVIMKNSEPWFVASDVCKALEISNNRDAIIRLDDDEKNTVALNDGNRGNPNMTIVNEPGLYSLVLGSRKPEAKAFKRWITHDVIPSIRKHGVYAVEEVLNDPDMLINALQALKDERTKNSMLEAEKKLHIQQIADMKPKVSYYDRIIASKNAVPITLIAKDYGMTAQEINKILHELGVQYSVGGTWALYSKYADKGYTKTHTYYTAYGHAKMHTEWTQSGRLMLYELLKSHGVEPVV